MLGGAITAAAAGDIVEVAAGTYHENINLAGKLITVRSAHGPATTIIDGGGKDSVVKLVSGETTAAVLTGVTIQNGNSADNLEGGGIQIENSAAAITGNRP